MTKGPEKFQLIKQYLHPATGLTTMTRLRGRTADFWDRRVFIGFVVFTAPIVCIQCIIAFVFRLCFCPSKVIIIATPSPLVITSNQPSPHQASYYGHHPDRVQMCFMRRKAHVHCTHNNCIYNILCKHNARTHSCHDV